MPVRFETAGRRWQTVTAEMRHRTAVETTPTTRHLATAGCSGDGGHRHWCWAGCWRLRQPCASAQSHALAAELLARRPWPVPGPVAERLRTQALPAYSSCAAPCAFAPAPAPTSCMAEQTRHKCVHKA
eukprot:259731-Chlamydomonas_euryale.AAC.15